MTPCRAPKRRGLTHVGVERGQEAALWDGVAWGRGPRIPEGTNDVLPDLIWFDKGARLVTMHQAVNVRCAFVYMSVILDKKL